MNLFGRLTLSAFEHGWIESIGQGVVVVGALGTLGTLLYYKKFGWLWRTYITSLDAKKIGIMYLVLAAVMGLRGFIDALMMRSEQATAVGAPGFLPPDHFAQIFTAHGVIMIFFVRCRLCSGFLT